MKVGDRFGRLTVVELIPGSHITATVKVRCDCGQEKIIDRHNTKRTKSCGCLFRELAVFHGARLKIRFKHGHRPRSGPSKTYNSWCAMIQRCHNNANQAFKYYGGRGITVCERWKSSFDAFLADMGERPAKKSIDRIDVNGNYSPDNCRWSTHSEQMTNTRPYRRGLHATI